MIAMADPANILVLDDLKLMTGNDVRPVVASEDDIHGLIGRMSRLDEAVAEAVEEEGEEETAPVAEIRESAEDAPVIKLVNSIVVQAVEDGASDVHFEPDGKDMRVRFRVDGVLRETTEIPRRMVPGVVSRVKIMADLDIAERRLPQDGRVGLKIEGHSVDVRVVTMPSVNGEGIVMRLLNKEAGLIDFDSLGMSDDTRARFETAFRQSYGAVLATGPTGSGKSTSLYAALRAINTPEKNIITVEDPVEYQLPGVTQVQVNLKSGLSFARALRSMLRADPDVIMVGESATARRRRSRWSPPSPGTWSSRRSTRTTPPPRSPASPRWRSSRSSPPRRSAACSPSGWCANSAPTAKRGRCCPSPPSSRRASAPTSTSRHTTPWAVGAATAPATAAGWACTR